MIGSFFESVRRHLAPSSSDAPVCNQDASTSATCKTTDLDVVVVVNPYSSGRFLVHELQQLGLPIVGVQSSADLPTSWKKQVPLNDPRFLAWYVHGGGTKVEATSPMKLKGGSRAHNSAASLATTADTTGSGANLQDYESQSQSDQNGN